MYRYKLTIAYDGTAYHGWQIQENLPTIAGTMASAFHDVFKMPVRLMATSRTDAGVHALGQVVTAEINFDLKAETIMRAWNYALPPDISICSLVPVDSSFNLFDVQQKTYEYSFFLKKPSPFEARFGWYYRKKVDLVKLQEALQIFIGTHDFRSFSTGDDRGDDTIRTLDTIRLEFVAHDQYRIVVQGQKFLHHMIRRIVGASLDVASRRGIPVDFLNTVLQQRNPHQQLTNAPALGLVLKEVIFNR